VPQVLYRANGGLTTNQTGIIEQSNNRTFEPERSGACNARPIAIGLQRVTETE